MKTFNDQNKNNDAMKKNQAPPYGTPGTDSHTKKTDDKTEFTQKPKDYANGSPIVQPTQNDIAARKDANGVKPQAAKGDDDVMSQDAHPGSDKNKIAWKQNASKAKITWSKLTEEELLKTEGQESSLINLVQTRYAVSNDEAQKQVKNFMEKCKC
jgi:uncharacterized protein YjbJ (UPF0337 family)